MYQTILNRLERKIIGDIVRDNQFFRCIKENPATEIWLYCDKEYLEQAKIAEERYAMLTPEEKAKHDPDYNKHIKTRSK